MPRMTDAKAYKEWLEEQGKLQRERVTANQSADLMGNLAAKAPLNSPELVTPALGTPASGTLTNCTGLPAAGLVPGTAESDFLLATTTPFTWVKKTLAQVKTILGLVLTQTANAVGFTIAGGTTSKTLTVEDTSLVNQDLTTDSAVVFASIRAAGADQLKVWTYTHTITAAEIVATIVEFSITSVTLSKVRAFLPCIRTLANQAGGEGMSAFQNYFNDAQISAATTVYFGLLASAQEGDIISVTIIEAV